MTNILIICDPEDKYSLSLKVVTYGDLFTGYKPDHIIILKPREDHPDLGQIREYVVEQVKKRIPKDRDIIYL